MVFKLPYPSPLKKEREPLGETLKILKKSWLNPGISLTSGMEAAILFAYGTFETFLPIYSIKIGLSAYEVGVLPVRAGDYPGLDQAYFGPLFRPPWTETPRFGRGHDGGLVHREPVDFQIFFPVAPFKYIIWIKLIDCYLGYFGLGSRFQPERNCTVWLRAYTRFHYGYRPHYGPVVSGIVAKYLGFTLSFIIASVILTAVALVFWAGVKSPNRQNS